MMHLAKVWRVLVIAGWGLLLAGCWESSDTPLDEQNESNYVRGKSLVTSGDYNPAIEAFEKALEVNPRNASAHLELFVIYEQQLRDYASAIYHGSRFCRLRPDSDYAKLIRQRMDSCKQELAKDLPVGPVTPQLQREIEKLNNENKNLREQVQSLIEKLTFATNRLANLSNTVVTQMMARVENPVSSDSPPPSPVRPASPSRVAAKNPPPVLKLAAVTSHAPVREKSITKTHVIKLRETLAIIARQNGISVAALQTANPSVDARRLKPGQILFIPAGKNR